MKKRKIQKKRFKPILLIGSIFLIFLSSPSFADEAHMKETLTQMIEQLQALKPLVEHAEKAQPQHPRISIHFDSWMDAVNRQDIEPRHYDPINNDFVGVP